MCMVLFNLKHFLFKFETKKALFTIFFYSKQTYQQEMLRWQTRHSLQQLFHQERDQNGYMFPTYLSDSGKQISGNFLG